MKIFVSNHLEILAEALKEELFQGSLHPFTKKWVVVPNEGIKHNLFLRWAHDPDLQVAAGVKMITWPEAMRRLFPNLPTKTELSLKIEAALNHDLLYAEPLFLYLTQGGSARKTVLCEKMSALFLQYLIQPEEKISDWLKQPGWQQSLWRAVFRNEMSCGTLEGLVYLFHPSQLSLYQLAAFKKMDAHCFLFSPCAMYWGDFRTFREQRFLLKRAGQAQEELAHYFENEHPLLANWGLKGRELLSLFEDQEWTDRYQEPSGDSVLKILQREMLALTIETKKIDDSIQIHSAPSKLREVEVVWEIIQRLPFEPREILVLAPDMQSYAPIIELVWRQRGGPFDFAIFGLEARSKSPLMQGLENLLDLPKFRFSKESVEKLLFCPPFLKRFGFDLEEVRRLSLWMSRVHVRYDLKDHSGSWEAGLKRLIDALVLTIKEDRLSIEFSEADLLSRWILVIQLFEKDLTTLDTPRSLKEWLKVLRSLVETFFALDSDDDLIHEFEKLQHIEIEGVFPFVTIERILKNIFQQNTGAVQASHLQAVRFVSLEKGALIPAKAVILMGMEEGSFPRQDLPCSLEQLHVASRVEEDKYLFLEALCSAREMFFMTYTRICPGDGKSQKVCPVVEELRRYCTGVPITDHPTSPFDPSYFQGEGFQSYSLHHFETLRLKKRTEEKKVPVLSEINFSTIDIRRLRKLARHPLQFFFEERLGIDFEWKERDTEFVLSPLEMARLR
ncbi:MAG: exodeoxyribonuclease V subunit gamma, partial [Thermodesulfobacteriota bacterium]